MTKVKIVALPAGKTSMSIVVPKTTMEVEKPGIEGMSTPKRIQEVQFPRLVPLDDQKQASALALNPTLTKAQAAIKLPSNVPAFDYMNQVMYGVTGNAEKPGLLNVSNAKKDLRGVANDVHQKYVNKINSTTDPNEKLYAFDQIKKIFGDAIPLNDDGSFGTIGQMMDKVKNSGKPPLVSDDLAARMGKPASKVNWNNPAIKQMRYDPTLNDDMMGDNDAEKTFNNAVQIYEKDPLFKDDPGKADYTAKKEKAMTTFQDDKNKAVIDQVNVGILKDFMETNTGRLGMGPEVKNDMVNRFFVNMGKSGSGKQRYSIKSFNQHWNELKENPNVMKSASMLADMAITASQQNWEAEDEYNMYGQKTYYGNTKPERPLLEDVFNKFGGNRGKLEPDDVFEQFEGKAQELLGMGWMGKMWNTERDVAGLVDALNQKGIDGKKILTDLYVEKWAKGGTEGGGYREDILDQAGTAINYHLLGKDVIDVGFGKNAYKANPDLELAKRMMKQSGASEQQMQEFYDAYADVPIAGYAQFQEAYGKALSHKDVPLLNYTVNFAGIKGQGGKGAVTNTVNVDASLPLSLNATGNKWAISVIDNLIPNIAGAFDDKGKYSMDNDNIDAREDMKYNEKVYVFDKPLKDVAEELDADEGEPTEDWDWTNSWGNLTDKTLDGLHIDALNNDAATILAAYRNSLYNQEDVGQASNDARATGELTTFPIALNTEDMTGYEIKISGKWLKKKGFQDDTEDKIFSMAIPKTMATNLAFKAVDAKDDMVDRAIMANGSYNIKNPGGTASITMNDKGDYIMNGTANFFDVNSGVLKTSILEPQTFPSMAFEGGKVAETVKQILINQQRNIEAIQNSNRANSTNKIFDPQQLLQQLLQQ